MWYPFPKSPLMKYGENQSLITKMQMEKNGSVKTKHTIC